MERTNLNGALHRPAPLGQTLLSHPPHSLTAVKSTHSVGLLGPTCLTPACWPLPTGAEGATDPKVPGTPSESVQPAHPPGPCPRPLLAPDSPTPSFPTAHLGFSLQTPRWGAQRGRPGDAVRAPRPSEGNRGVGRLQVWMGGGGSSQAFHTPRSGPTLLTPGCLQELNRIGQRQGVPSGPLLGWAPAPALSLCFFGALGVGAAPGAGTEGEVTSSRSCHRGLGP